MKLYFGMRILTIVRYRKTWSSNILEEIISELEAEEILTSEKRLA